MTLLLILLLLALALVRVHWTRVGAVHQVEIEIGALHPLVLIAALVLLLCWRCRP